MKSQKQSTRGERWFGWLVGLTAAVGAVWYYSWIWLPRGYLEVPFVALAFIVIAVVFVVRWRDRRRAYAAREATVDRQVKAGER